MYIEFTIVNNADRKADINAITIPLKYFVSTLKIIAMPITVNEAKSISYNFILCLKNSGSRIETNRAPVAKPASVIDMLEIFIA